MSDRDYAGRRRLLLGGNKEGELGDGKAINSTAPVPILGQGP
jgi:hypothetical protein